MKITLKSYDDLKNLITDNGEKTISNEMDWFIKEFADKTLTVRNYDVAGGGKITEFFSISTNSVGEDGGFNTNTVFEHIKVPKSWITDDGVDYEGINYYACLACGFTVTDNQRTSFNPKKTYAEIGVDDCVCPLCFTKTFKKVN